MNASEYRAARVDRGPQVAVAAKLGVDYRTIQRREAGTIPVTHEAELALLTLPKLKKSRGKI